MNVQLATILTLISNLKKTEKGVQFVSVNYINDANEQQRTVFNVGVSYQTAKKKDLEYLQNLDVTTLESGIDTELLNEAKEALIKALIKPNKAMSDGQKNAYEHLGNGLKMHVTEKELYVYGMKVKKTVLVEGTYKADTRKPLTVAKDELRKGMKSTKYRQFNISKMKVMKLQGDTLVFNG
jgi:hypothetical protein